MLWLAVPTLPDGTRVESSLVAPETLSVGFPARAYRLCLADGSVTDFPTLTSIVRHNVDH